MQIATLDVGLSTHNHTASSSLVSILNTLQTHNVGTCWEVRTLDVLHQGFYIHILIIDVSHAGIDYFTEVMSRNIGGHTNSNTCCTIHQEVRNLGRHNGRFRQGIVKVHSHINGFLVQVIHHSLAHHTQTSLGITHSSRAVTVYRTEVTLTVDKRVAHVPVLCHADEGTVD